MNAIGYDVQRGCDRLGRFRSRIALGKNFVSYESRRRDQSG